MNLPRTGTARADAASQRDWFLVILVGAILFVRGVYILSYPFHIEGDGETYYALLQASQAHLLHATGYIFFSLPVRLLATLFGTEPASLLLYFQQAFSTASVTVLYLALKRVTPRWVGFLVCLPLGIDAQMVAASGTSRPEFLQGDILMLLVSAAIFALTSVSHRKKTIFYLGAGILGMAGYLTKYNFLPMLVFCLMPFFDAALPWKSRFRMLGGSCLGATALFLVFFSTFHYPTTHSLQLNLEHGWIHVLKLKEANIPILPENGIATQKYIILAESLPPLGSLEAWTKMDAVPDTVRAPFREKWRPLLATNDAEQVRNALNSLTPGRTGYDDLGSFGPVYQYLGLKEAEKLLRAVFLEGVRRYPERYLSNVGRGFIQSAVFSESYKPYLPVPGVYKPSALFQWSKPPFLSARARFSKSVDWAVATPAELERFAAQIWYPGARLFSWLSFLKYIPSICLWIVMLAGFVVLPISILRNRRVRPAEALFMLVATALLGEMSFAAVLFVFRSKELMLCQPLIYLMMGLSVSLWVEFAATRRQPVARATSPA